MLLLQVPRITGQVSSRNALLGGQSLRCHAKLIRTLSAARLPEAEVVSLNYTAYLPPDGNKTDNALVLMHGLLGSKRIYTSFAKSWVKDLNVPIYALDLRNHGGSPHAAPMSYSTMADDVLHFIKAHSLRNITLLGHSMGGKVAMSVALNPALEDPSNASILSNLIVADVAPWRKPIPPEHKDYLEGMRQIERSKVTKKEDALRILEPYEPDPLVRAFLLTNLVKPARSVSSQSHSSHQHDSDSQSSNRASPSVPHPRHQYAKFQVPIDALEDAIPEFGSFPYEPGERTWPGRTLFIKGLNSGYINRRNRHSLAACFPNMQLRTLDGGHWIFGDRPKEFKQLVGEFVRRDNLSGSDMFSEWPEISS